MNSPIISIIIPIYNTEKYLEECLRSVQDQTISNFEAILVNDCTPDNSMEIANRVANKDPRFRVYEHDENGGPGKARNTGIKVAHGKYLNFLDSDDFLPKDALQIMLNIATKNNADMVIGNMSWIYNHQLYPVQYIHNHINFWKRFSQKNLRDLAANHYLSGSMCHRLIKKEVFIDGNIQFPEKVLHEDMPVTLETWFFCKKIVATDRFVYFRTRRDDLNNLSRTQTYNEKAFLDRDIIAERIFEFSRCNATKKPSAVQLGVTTLFRLLSTTSEMLKNVDDSIKFKISKIWYPKHLLKINSMINELNSLND
jgi:glycosyltransferase involved in cell wall biosynthesis